MKDLKFRKISNTVDKSKPIIKTKDITNDTKICTLDVVINKVYIEKKEDRTYIKLYISDNFDSLYALSIQENQYYDEIVSNISLHDRYHIMGYIVNCNDDLSKMFNLETNDKVLLLRAMENITENEINGFFEDKIADESLICLYDYSVDDSYAFIKKNFNYLEGIKLEEVQDIRYSFNHDVLILLKNGNLLFNGKQKFDNIRKLVFVSGNSIFAITNELEIINTLNKSLSSLALNDNNYKYKKIYYDYEKIIALTYDNKLKIFGSLHDEFINPERFINIEDIGVNEDDKYDIMVKQDGKFNSLFYSNNDDNNDVKVILQGKGDFYNILL